MTALVDRPLEEWAVSRALFPTRLTQERCARKKKETNPFSQMLYLFFKILLFP